MKATHIVVIQSGWVFVGTLATGDNAPANKLVLHDAACVRRWGTERGLGELALAGPRKETQLDPCGTVEAPAHAVLFTIPVVQSKWKP